MPPRAARVAPVAPVTPITAPSRAHNAQRGAVPDVPLEMEAKLLLDFFGAPVGQGSLRAVSPPMAAAGGRRAGGGSGVVTGSVGQRSVGCPRILPASSIVGADEMDKVARLLTASDAIQLVDEVRERRGKE